MVAQTPPMGWNSWDCFGAAVNEAQVRENADYMAKYLKPYGYEYVVVDIEWYQPTADNHFYEPFSELVMDEYGRLLPAPNRFPSAAGGQGFAPLAKYVHELGLKFGIHIMRGMPRMAAHNHLPIEGSSYNAKEVANPNNVCGWNPDMYGLKCEKNEAGSRAYYESIFRLYASWGVDYVKVDDIAREYPHYKREIELISESLRSCGRDMVLSLSPGPAPVERAEHLSTYANMWRITDDFWDRWDLLLNMFDRAKEWAEYAGEGHWPDADMLPVGALRQCDSEDEWTRFTEDEQITMMSLWCMMRSPLMIGAHMPKNDEFTLKILTNEDVLGILKETAGAHELYRTEEEIAWKTFGTDGKRMYLAFFNISEEETQIEIDLEDTDAEEYETCKELWTGEAYDPAAPLSMTIPPHGARLFGFYRN